MRSRKWILAAGAAVAVVLLLVAPTAVYEGGGGAACARCHEIRDAYDQWTVSAHRNVECSECHGGVLTADPGFHWSNLERLIRHWRGEPVERVLLAGRDEIDRLVSACKSCHEREFADWQAGPHSVSYADIFLDEEHNSKRRLMDDCLRCHGMHFEGGIRDLVEPVDTRGPWRLKVSELADEPAIPCLVCHEIHRRGEPRPEYDRAARDTRDEPVMPASLAFFDRRTQVHLAVSAMPLPEVREGGRALRMSPDPRQALCYQCHAPRAGMQAGSGDDRTCRGIHEGIGCLACHAGHTMETRASCANCHPRFSNCGLGLEKLNELVRAPGTRFDIHNLKCADCHPKGVPPRRWKRLRERTAD